MTKPLIGICAPIEFASYTVWEQLAYLLPVSYVAAIQRAGGLVVMLPVDEAAIDEPDLLLDRIDALILAGGADIDPSSYGAADVHPETKGTYPQRDRFEVALVRRAVDRDMPVLGICRGMQLINVALGGTLMQHVPDTVGHGEHRRTPGSFDDADHDVRLAAGSLAARAAGTEVHATKSHHHQAVDRLGEGLTATGWSVGDELIEAIEAESGYTLGVQWHPEADSQSGVIASLVQEARARIAGRAV